MRLCRFRHNQVAEQVNQVATYVHWMSDELDKARRHSNKLERRLQKLVEHLKVDIDWADDEEE